MSDPIPRRLLLATVVAELLVILVWALAFSQPWLINDPMVIPAGVEYGSAVQPYQAWIRFRECGLCALWNGIEGGYPALADVHGSTLHPVVMLSVLLFGMPYGAKVALAGALILGGWAQWWLAWELRLTGPARLFTGSMAVVSGHLASRMEPGWINVVVATAAVALVIPALVRLARRTDGASAAILAVTLACAIVAGQAYLQIGLLAVLPFALLLVRSGHHRSATARFGVAAVLGGLLAAPLLIPLVHFWPQFFKDFDQAFVTSQPFRYVWLNLVIGEPGFYQAGVLGQRPFPGLYAIFVGWIPVLLAIWGLGAQQPARRRAAIFLSVVASVCLLLASALPLRWLVSLLPEGSSPAIWISTIRNPMLIGGLAVPAVLALAGLGLDRLLKAPWPEISAAAFRIGDRELEAVRLDPRVLLAVPLALALWQGWQFNRTWVRNVTMSQVTMEQIGMAQTDNSQWVTVLPGEHVFVEPAVRAGLKLTDDLRPWYWRDRPKPAPYVQVLRGMPTAPEGYEQLQTIEGVTAYGAGLDAAYAVLETDTGQRIPCDAAARGGDIDVACQSGDGGRLVVKENRWPGWAVSVDGGAASLADEPTGRWLAVQLPPGRQSAAFRYRPLDAALGFLLHGLGWAGVAVVLVGGQRRMEAWRKLPWRSRGGDN